MRLSNEKIKLTELNILKSFADFCKVNELTYFLCGGTLLGAIRHDGFIPWDDDIDVFMPRPDYEKFLSLTKQKPIRENYITATYENTEKTINYPFIKILDTTTLVCEQTKSECVSVWIDVFAIDGVPDDEKKSEKLFSKNIFLKHLLAAASDDLSKITQKRKRIIKSLIKPFIQLYGLQRLAKKIDLLSKKYDFKESKYVACSHWGYGACEKMLKSELIPIKHVFENDEFVIPANYDLYLKNLYGDYMTPPPVEKQIRHDFSAYELNEICKKDDILKQKKFIEKLSSKNNRSLIMSKVFLKLGFTALTRKLGRHRQALTIPFLENENLGLLQKTYNYEDLKTVDNPPVFIMWYQGFDNLPEVISKCIKSITKNIKNREFVYISRENVHLYADLPDIIYESVDSGRISKTFFSDIVRAALLYKNGGTWIDAATYISKEISEDYFNRLYYCPSGIISEQRNEFRYLFQGTKGWNISFQGTNVLGFPLYDYLYNSYINYLNKFERQIFYFQTDYLISLFLKYNNKYRELVNSQQENNIYEFELALLMNKKSNSRNLKKLDFMEENFIHKLTYKKNWKIRKGDNTIASYIFNRPEDLYED